MRGPSVPLLTAAAVLSSPAAKAAETLKFGRPPAWVVPAQIPADAATTDAPLATLLLDQQILFELGKIVTFAETAVRIQNPQGLGAGNVLLSWNPATDDVTVNKVHIRRGDKIIDVLASGQTFTILRRESNLEAAVLDGTLTATIQPEGLQEGDIINLATTIERSDPVMKGHVEALFAPWNGLPIESAQARVTWPASLKVNSRQSAGLPAPQRHRSGGSTTLELAARKIQPLIPPKGAPPRFALGRFAEASDFSSWGEVAELFAPLYRSAAAIPASGPLGDELNRIRQSSNDPKVRAEQALALVQDRIRYVALAMGQGGYVPVPAETTWSRRFGDCKAKTALLLGLLHELGIEAEPVAVNSRLGDAVAGRLPMVSVFDHVLVRARIGSKTYWLDGTRTGDRKLDSIAVPDFGWGLPLVSNASLVHLVPPPLDRPEEDTRATIDASKGIHAPAPVTFEKIIRGDVAVVSQRLLSSLTEAQRQEIFRSYLKGDFDFITFKAGSYTFDKDQREFRITINGDAKLDWSGGIFYVPASTVGYDPDFERSPGPLQDAPFAVTHPVYSRTVISLQLPQSFLAERRLGSATINETLAGIEYFRTASVTGDVLTIETRARTLVPEITFKEAIAAKARLKALADEHVALPLPARYRPTGKDLAAIAGDKPASAKEFLRRGLTFLDSGKYDQALDDFDRAVELEPNNVWPIANRAIARVWKRDFDAAAKDLKRAENLDPDNPVVLRAKALQAELNGDFRAAAELYSKSLQKQPGNAFALMHRARAFAAMGEDEKALADSAEALQANPQLIDLRVTRANIFLRQGRRDDVAREAELLMTDNPKSDYALVGAGKIYARIGRTAEAMRAFERALAIEPQAYIYVNRAQARSSSDHAGRLSDLEAALKLNPDDIDTLAEKANQLLIMGDFKRALAVYDRLVNPSSAFSDYAIMRAIALYKLGRVAEAQKIFADERRKAKTSSDFNNLCWDKATAGILLESALAECREAQRLERDSSNIMDSLGFILLRLGKVDEAIRAYDAAITKKNGAESYMGRAMAYARKGDKARAATDRLQATTLDPDVEVRFAQYGMKLETPVIAGE